MKEKNNNIEQFFNKKFSQEILEEDWNSLPEDVWDSIAENLDEEPKKRRFLFFLPWLFASLGFLFLAYISIGHLKNEKRLSHLENKIELLDKTKGKQTSTEKNNSIKHSSTLDQKSVIGSKATVANDVTPTMEENPQKEFSSRFDSKRIENATKKETELSASKPQVVNEKSGGQPFSNEISNSQNRLPIVNNFFNPILKATENTIPTEGENSKSMVTASSANRKIDIENALIFINPLTPMVCTIDIERRKTNESIFLDYSEIIEAPDLQSKLSYLGLTGRYNNWIQRNTGMIDNPLEELLTQEQTRSSVSLGLMASSQMTKKFTFDLGFYYNQRSLESNYLLHLPFEKSTEVLEEGFLVNKFSHSLPTSLGNVDTDVVLARSQSSVIGDSEIVDVDLSFLNRSSSVILPMSFSYYPKEAFKGMFFSLGLTHEITLTHKLEQIETLSHHTDIRDHFIQVDYNSSQQRRYALSGSLGMGYSFKLADALLLQVRGNYDLALSNRYSNNGYSHQLDNLSFGLGVVRVLK